MEAASTFQATGGRGRFCPLQVGRQEPQGPYPPPPDLNRGVEDGKAKHEEILQAAEEKGKQGKDTLETEGRKEAGPNLQEPSGKMDSVSSGLEAKPNQQQNRDESKHQVGESHSQQRIFCSKCRSYSHLSRDCKLSVFCIIFAKETHRTEDCIRKNQKKPVAKVVGCAAPGLGYVLIQSAKGIVQKEHVNSLAIVTIMWGGDLTEQALEEVFTPHFKWNWTWKARMQEKGVSHMRFPNKMKLDELAKFDSIRVKGTSVHVKVKKWTQEAEAVGMLHEVWVTVEGVPDEMKDYDPLHEVGSNLGPVIEVDMVTLKTKDVVRIRVVRVGMMTLKSLPLTMTLVTPKLLVYKAHFKLEQIVELGWFRDCAQEKRAVEVAQQNEPSNIDHMQRNKKPRKEEAASSMGVLEKAGDKKKTIVVEEDSDNESAQAELVKLKQMEIDRELALRVQLEEQFKVKQIQLDKIEEVIYDEDEPRVLLVGSEEIMESQESSDFAVAVGVVLSQTDEDMTEEKRKKSLRLMEKEDKKVADAAAERKEALNAFINKGCALEAVDTNLNLIKNLELARINLFLKEKLKTSQKGECENVGENLSDIDINIDEVLHSDDCMSDFDYAENMLRLSQSNSSGKKRRKNNI
ncbi:hypothetical protein OsJ_00822 [Oryza sativa Japonica Group]|uniref:Transposable element protein, putative n=2 Tax=Oryza sativa subsp. japonica TaxID=39947 RepID=A2ZQI2_ORYSJ|nr:Transposable element protein, putative [Oryza sativa Japonica Group]ABA92468.1 Zinc knuckle family protein [Oryza sativa Japonica Group]EAZ10979.1 hypothetical protein OsJ_00822 [Oryza sativa Japonica Group]